MKLRRCSSRRLFATRPITPKPARPFKTAGKVSSNLARLPNSKG